MSAARLAGLALTVGLLHSTAACAGIYDPGESKEEVATYPDFIRSPTNRNFRDVVLILRTIPGNLPAKKNPLAKSEEWVDNPVRRRYAFLDEMITSSPGLGARDFKAPEEWLQASAVLIRRNKFKQAEQLLRRIALTPDERDNILLQSNFATALYRNGNPLAAYETLREAIKSHWDRGWGALPEPRRAFLQRIGWSDAVFDLYRKYDTYYLKLLRLRLKERAATKETQGSLLLPDALFDDGQDPPTPVRFLNEAGEFQAGRIADAERKKLPAEALAIVQQLIVWMPDDLRLYWLLGELYNAQQAPPGKENEEGVRAAHQVFADLETEYKRLAEATPETVKSRLQERLGALKAAVDHFDAKLTRDVEGKIRDREKTEDAGFPIDWRTVAVSFGVGFLLALFAVWQIREIQRRRQVRLGDSQASHN